MISGMLRGCLTVLSALSLVLCTATGYLWFRSYSHDDRVVTPWLAGVSDDWYRQQKYRIARSSDGGLELEMRAAGRSSSLPPVLFNPHTFDDDTLLGFNQFFKRDQFIARLGFSYESWTFQDFTCAINFPRTLSRMRIPYWALTLFSAFLPMIWSVRQYRGAHRILAGCCPACGYDLRATPDRCPECGTSAQRNSDGPVPSADASPGNFIAGRRRVDDVHVGHKTAVDALFQNFFSS
jgi:hypothetical protein